MHINKGIAAEQSDIHCKIFYNKLLNNFFKLKFYISSLSLNIFILTCFYLKGFLEKLNKYSSFE
jgi:hypothetical protein